MATDIPDLLAKIDGRTVQIGDRKVTLATAGLAVERIEPDWRTELLSVLTNPNIAFILLLVGVYGLIFEFITPGRSEEHTSELPSLMRKSSAVFSLKKKNNTHSTTLIAKM